MWVWKMKVKDDYKVLALASGMVVTNTIIILNFVGSRFIHLKNNSELTCAPLRLSQHCENDMHKAGAE